jgi:glycosyltransferase involved in cell wall biosynthesis
MDEARIQILIPTCNCVGELETTMKSIQSQNFNPDNIYITIADFGSNDGTYEKAMSYIPQWKWLGVYTRPFQKNWRQRMADLVRISSYVCPVGVYCFSIVLYPGDVLYPECLRKLSEVYIQHYSIGPVSLICESDILMPDGTVHKQKPLFSGDCLIDGRENLDEYVKRGYMHQIFQMTVDVPVQTGNRHRLFYYTYEGRCWNKLVNENKERYAIYVQEPMACTKRIDYEDELQEILFRWENIVMIVQYFSYRYGESLDEGFIRAATENMAEYALWRSFCLYQKDGNRKDIEDCFLISRVIAPSIQEKEIHRMMHGLIEEKNPKMETEIEEYFRGQS